jgi:transcriptional regulator PpsR
VFQGLDPEQMALALQTSADVAMVVNRKGKVTAVEFYNPDLGQDLLDYLRGRQLSETVSDEVRTKVDDLLSDLGGASARPLARDLVHRLEDGSEFPVRYWQAGRFADGRQALLGRDQRAFAALQQQVLDAQMALEQDYWRLRYVETRYRLLFQLAGEPLLIVDEATSRVLEANTLADALLGPDGRRIVGKVFPIGFDKKSSEVVRKLLFESAAIGRADADGLLSANGESVFSATVNFLRQGDDATYLVRLHEHSADLAVAGGKGAACLDSVLQYAPDAVVLTDTEGRVRSCNQTFLDLAQLASTEQVTGRSIDRWLGRSGVDLNVLLNNLRQHQSVRLFATKLRSEYQTSIDVEISAGAYSDDDGEGFAFFVRDVGRRLGAEPNLSARLPRSVEQITQQVGRMPLKELVRQSTDLVEKLCIETALELTSDNRASAAELLGVSRQGLYAKLNRYGLGEKATEE